MVPTPRTWRSPRTAAIVVCVRQRTDWRKTVCDCLNMSSLTLNSPLSTHSPPGNWPGHLEITSKSLLSILEKAASGASDISIAERSLFMACEFWAATKARSLARHLGANAHETLQVMGTIFATVGAPAFASDLDAACTDLTARPGDVRRLKCINALQNRLLATDEPVDTLLARFAVELLGNSNARRRRAGIAAQS